MSRRTTPAEAGRAARHAVDAIAALLDATGHPDGARLRACLEALDQVAPHAARIAGDADPLAALLEQLAAHTRRRRLPRR